MARKSTAERARHARIACGALLALALVLAGCGDGGGGGGAAAERAASAEATGAPFDPPQEVVMPTTSVDGNPAAIDVSHVNEGYVAASGRSSARLKLQVTCGEMTYNYDLPNDGTPTFYPVNMGSGSYGFRVMENIEGTTYAELTSTYVDVALNSETCPFVVPNLYCDYDEDSACVEQARELTEDCENQGEAVRDICSWVVGAISYDYDKAEELAQSTGYVPDPDETLETRTGICFDYASLTAAMLRSVGLPAQVVTGYVSPDDLYHAWVMVRVDGTWQTVQFSVTPNQWSRCDVTFASTGGDAFSGDGTTYTDRYTY